MSNIVDYIKWRGDTLMQYSPVNNVDCLIFCTLAYLPFDNVVSSQLLGHSVTISQVCEALLSKSISNELAQPLTSNQAELLSALLYSDRFKNIKLVGFRNIHSQEVQTQFSATTFILPDNTVYVAYRGTDGSLVGWKEDFNLSFMKEVPAQEMAERYLNEVGVAFRESIRVGGHSKGGNLAVFASLMCDKEIYDRILDIVSMDGPGFNQETISGFVHKQGYDLVRKFVPQFDIVGMLLIHDIAYTIVKSDAEGIMQHDPFSWQVTGDNFIIAGHLDPKSILIDQAVRTWLCELSFTQRKQLINNVYSLLGICGATTLKELWTPNNKLKIADELVKMPEEERKLLERAMGMLKSAYERVLLSDVWKRIISF